MAWSNWSCLAIMIWMVLSLVWMIVLSEKLREMKRKNDEMRAIFADEVYRIQTELAGVTGMIGDFRLEMLELKKALSESMRISEERFSDMNKSLRMESVASEERFNTYSDRVGEGFALLKNEIEQLKTEKMLE